MFILIRKIMLKLQSKYLETMDFKCFFLSKTCLMLCLINVCFIGFPSTALASSSLMFDDAAIRAKIIPKKQAQLSAPKEGQVVVHVEEGEKFNEGKLLVSLNCDVEEARMDVLVLEVERAEKRRLAQEKLSETGSVGSLELALSEISVRESQANLNLVKQELKQCSVFAPYDGVVAKNHINDWEYANKSDLLIDIFDTSELEIEFLVPSVWLNWLQTNDQFHILVRETNTSLLARIKKIDIKINPVSQSVKIWGEFDEEQHNLIPGMSGEVRFVSEL